MLWILLLGVATGMRTMTGIAVLCWFAWLELLPVGHGWAMWTGKLISVIVFTLFALGEYYGDTLPTTPSRKAPGPALTRLVVGGLCGAIAALSLMEPLAGGVILGALGALIGTYAGYAGRMQGAKLVGRDLPVALAESALALAISVGSLWMLHNNAIQVARDESRTFF